MDMQVSGSSLVWRARQMTFCHVPFFFRGSTANNHTSPAKLTQVQTVFRQEQMELSPGFHNQDIHVNEDVGAAASPHLHNKPIHPD